MEEIKLDFGCGPNKQAGFIGVDVIPFEGVDVVLDLNTERWPWEDNSITEVFTSHFVEHLEAHERVHFINELHRILKPGGKCTIITPHWASTRAYGDLTHKWPPVAEFWYYYLSKDWRKVNAPHSKYTETVDFEAVWGYAMNPALVNRNIEFQQFAFANYKEAINDLHATITKK